MTVYTLLCIVCDVLYFIARASVVQCPYSPYYFSCRVIERRDTEKQLSRQ